VLGPIIVLGIGVGLTFAPAIATATAAVPDEDAGVASAMVNTSQQIGGAVGTAVLSTVFTSALARYASSHPPGPRLQSAAAISGYTVAFGVACVLFLVGAAATAVLLRSGRLATSDSPPDDGATVDIEQMQRRISELESQNRYLQELLHIRSVSVTAVR
jgi:MFS family permease